MQRKNHAVKTALSDGSRLPGSRIPVSLSNLRIGIVVSEFHSDITGRLLDGALAALEKCKVKRKNIDILRVPGSFEIPFGCLSFIDKKRYRALVALGCIIKGKTNHDVYIASAVSRAIIRLSLDHRVPIGFGIITANNLAQAKARSSRDANKGKEAALAAVSMAALG